MAAWFEKLWVKFNQGAGILESNKYPVSISSGFPVVDFDMSRTKNQKRELLFYQKMGYAWEVDFVIEFNPSAFKHGISEKDIQTAI